MTHERGTPDSVTSLDLIADNYNSAAGNSVRAIIVRSVVSYIVVAALTLHTLLGCCWHHAHASAIDSLHVDAEKAPTASHCCCHHHHGDVESEHDEAVPSDAIEVSELGRDRQAPAPCSDSCEGKCQFVSTSRATIEQPIVQGFAWILPATTLEVVCKNACVRFVTRRTTAPPLPMRVHLWNQLLLI